MSQSVVELSREVVVVGGSGQDGSIQCTPSSSTQTTSESSPLLAKKQSPFTHMPKGEIRTYWWRWVVLLVFLLNSTVNNALWITFAPVADVMRCYYNIDNSLVNTLSIVSAVITVLLTLPSAWMLVRFGLRFTIILASSATALGGALRLIGAGSKYFPFLLAGQLVSSFNGLQFGATTLLSEIWFSPSERVTATAISASIAPQIGVLISYALSPTILYRNDTLTVCGNSSHPQINSHHELYSVWKDDMFQRIFYYLLGQAAISVLVFLITIVAFPNAPPTPPSLSRKLESGARAVDETTCEENKSFLISMLEFMRIPRFVLFLFAAGINIGVSGAIISLLNELVLPYFPDNSEQIAYLGITAQVSSILALIFTGRLLDFTKTFYLMSLLAYALAITSILVFTLLLQFYDRLHFYTLYVPVGFIGASVTSFQVIALEYSVEMTYPLPEGTSAGLLNLFGLTISVILIAGVGKLHDKKMYIGAWIITALTIVGGFLVVFVRPELKRSKIDNAKDKLIQTQRYK